MTEHHQIRLYPRCFVLDQALRSLPEWARAFTDALTRADELIQRARARTAQLPEKAISERGFPGGPRDRADGQYFPRSRRPNGTGCARLGSSGSGRLGCGELSPTSDVGLETSHG